LRAWQAAKGEFVCNSNADDFHHPRFTDIMYNAAHNTNNAKVAFWYGGIVVIEEDTMQVKGMGKRQEFSRERFSCTKRFEDF
jgi:hypothetical protein